MDNPLDVFSESSPPTIKLPVNKSSSTNIDLKMGVVVAVIAFVVIFFPIEGTIGRYLPLIKSPLCGGAVKAIAVGLLSALLVGFT